MARPQKSGLDYFPLATNIFDSGSELMPVIRRYGAAGLGAYLYVLCSIYQNGYYYKTSFFDDYIGEMSDILKEDETKIRDSLALLEKINVLTILKDDDSVVLTSRGVQKRYTEVAKDRKRNAAEFLESVLGKYWLLTPEDTLKHLGVSKAASDGILAEPKKNKNGENSFSPNNGGFSPNNGGYSPNNGGYSRNNPGKTELIPEKPYFFSFHLANSDNKSIENNDNGYSNNDNGKKGNEEDEFEKEIEREKRESEVREKLGLTPKLSRASKDDPAVEVKTEFDVEGYKRFSKRWGISLTDTQNYSGAVYEVNWDVLTKKIEQSKFLREKLSWALILNNYTKIMAGQYDDYKREETSGEKLNRVLEQIKNEEAADGDAG